MKKNNSTSHSPALNPAFTDLRKLYHATVLSDECNFARASARLCITQSALTRSIQSLESMFDVILFDRSHSKVTTTPAGVIILDKARSLLLHAGTLVNDVALLRDAKTGNVSFGVGLNPASISLPEVLVKLYREQPHLSIFIERRTNDELKSLLLNEMIEFYIGHQYHNEDINPNLSEEKLTQIPVHLFCRKGHPLLTKKNINLDDLKSFPTAITQNAGFSHHSNHLLNLANSKTPNKKQGLLVVNDIQCLEALSLNTDTIMVCSKKAVEKSLSQGLLEIVDVGDPELKLSLSCNIIKIRGRTLSPAAELIIYTIKNLIKNEA